MAPFHAVKHRHKIKKKINHLSHNRLSWIHTEYSRKWKLLSNIRLCEPMDCSPPVSSVHVNLQARILEWVAVPFSRGSSQPRNWTRISCIVGRFFTSWTTREAKECSYNLIIIYLKGQQRKHVTRHFSKDTQMTEGLGAGGEGDDRGWDGWMASSTQWTWVWVDSGSWWWTREAWCAAIHGAIKSQTRLNNWTELNKHKKLITITRCYQNQNKMATHIHYYVYKEENVLVRIQRNCNLPILLVGRWNGVTATFKKFGNSSKF